MADLKRTHYIDFIAGSVAGSTCKLFEYPMDTIKVLQQTTFKGVSAFKCFSTTVSSTGMRGLYNGLLTPLLSCTLETAVLFYAYEKTKTLLASSTISPFWINALAGSVAGACTSFLTTPVEFIKCNLQVQGQSATQRAMYSGPMDCVVKTMKSNGVRGLYKGYFATMMREAPGSCLWFVVYEEMAKLLIPPGQTKNNIPAWKLMVAGSVSGIAYWTAFFPADVIKTQLQTSREGNQRFWKTFRNILQTNGVRGLYLGYWVTVLRAIPSNALLFVSYEITKRAIQGVV